MPAGQDGTINYLLLPSITTGLRFLSAYLPFLPIRMAALTHYLASELEALTYPNSDGQGKRVCRVLSRIPGEGEDDFDDEGLGGDGEGGERDGDGERMRGRGGKGRRPSKVGEAADTGSVISCLFYDVRTLPPIPLPLPFHSPIHPLPLLSPILSPC